jgi:hypothetical protein
MKKHSSLYISAIINENWKGLLHWQYELLFCVTDHWKNKHDFLFLKNILGVV